jgi:hypothetical protein
MIVKITKAVKIVKIKSALEKNDEACSKIAIILGRKVRLENTITKY